jgi:glutamate N-acetyltransferase/amino-acid N-acetyltransferase
MQNDAQVFRNNAMPVNLSAPDPAALFAVPGVRIGVAEAGVRKANRKDLTVVLLDDGSAVGGVFTQNRFCAAPVQVCRDHLASNFGIRAMVINTGNANAGTGEDGLMRTRATCIALARHLEIAPEQILPFSTGVIMEPLPVDRIEAGLPAALADAGADHWARAAEGIMTTDTIPRPSAQRVQVGGATVTVTGISKGAGMIRPNMATMLGFMATDARIDPALMQPLAKLLADASFNRVTIDGDTSTNDSFVVIATQKAARPISSLDSADGQVLGNAMQDVARQLAQAIVRDGEGATKFITVRSKAAGPRRMPAGGLRHCAFAAGQDGVLRQRPEPWPHPGGRGLCGHRRPRPDWHRPVPGRRACGGQGWAQPRRTARKTASA